MIYDGMSIGLFDVLEIPLCAQANVCVFSNERNNNKKKETPIHFNQRRWFAHFFLICTVSHSYLNWKLAEKRHLSCRLNNFKNKIEYLMKTLQFLSILHTHYIFWHCVSTSSPVCSCPKPEIRPPGLFYFHLFMFIFEHVISNMVNTVIVNLSVSVIIVCCNFVTINDMCVLANSSSVKWLKTHRIECLFCCDACCARSIGNCFDDALFTRLMSNATDKMQ